MRKCRLVCGIIFFIVLGLSEITFAYPWKVVKRGESFPLFGRPFSIDQLIENPDEVIKNNHCYYTYKFIINRPSGDNGWGIAQYGNIRARLYYWAATLDTNPYATLYSDKDVYQHPHSNPRKVVVHLLNGLTPGKYRISVGIIPYPMYGNYSFRKIIQFYRGPYVSFLKDVITAVSAATPQTALLKILGSKVTDETINAGTRIFATQYGQIIDIEVLAKMPAIFKKSETTAAKMLRMRNLVPQPDYSHPVNTTDKSLNGMVAVHRFTPGTRLRAGTNVPYKLYKYTTQQYGGQQAGDPLAGIAGKWEFGRKNKTYTYLGYVILSRRKGKYGGYYIDGYSHPNEAYWRPTGKNSIVFLHKNGQPTTYFKLIRPGYWEGRFIPPKDGKNNNTGAVIHYLRKR